jgi:phage-related protein
MEIVYYTSTSGNNPIAKYLSSIKNLRHKRQILDDIELLVDLGLSNFKRSTDIKKIKGFKKNIWELRTRCPDNIIYRTLFEHSDNKIIILHIFNKKDQKIRKQEIEKAINRLQ